MDLGLTIAIDKERCIGCGACALRCPNNAITIEDKNFIRILSLDLKKCDNCHGAPICVSICPEKAISLSPGEINSGKISIEFEIVPCSNCGKPTKITKKEALKIIKIVGGGSKRVAFLCNECRIKKIVR